MIKKYYKKILTEIQTLPKWMILLIIIISLLSTVHLLILMNAPDGLVFVEYGDDLPHLAAMKSVEWGFTDPWSERSIFSVTYTSPFLFVPLGIIAYVLSIDYFIFFYVFKILVSFVYIFAVYKFMRFFYPKYAKNSLILFLLFAGIGGWIYLTFYALGTDTDIVAGITYDYLPESAFVNIFSHITRIYYMVPVICGLLSILFFAKERSIIAGIFLGLSFVFYPVSGLGFAIIILIYSLLYSKTIKEAIKKVLPVALVMFIISIPALYMQLIDTYYVDIYIKYHRGSASLLKLIVSFLPFAVLSVYYLKKPIAKKSYILGILGFVISAIFVHHQLTSTVNFIEYIFPGFVFVSSIYIFYSKMKKEDKFLLIWIVIMAWMSVASTEIVPWNAHRFTIFLLLPLTLLATKGVVKLGKSLSINHNKIILLMVLIALPTFILYNMEFQIFLKKSNPYIYENLFEPIKYLESLPSGTVFSSGYPGHFIPYYSGHKSISSSEALRMVEQEEDIEKFYTGDDETKLAILEKYNAKYVFYSPHERQIGDTKFDEKYFRLIYNNSDTQEWYDIYYTYVVIYEVVE